MGQQKIEITTHREDNDGFVMSRDEEDDHYEKIPGDDLHVPSYLTLSIQNLVDKNISVQENVSKKSLTCEKPAKKELKGCKRYWGISLGIMSSLLFSLGNLCVKLLSDDYHPFSVGIYRFAGILWPSIFILLYQVYRGANIFGVIYPISQPGKVQTLLCLFARSVIGCTAAILLNYSFNFMPMADSTVITFSSSVFTTFLACLFLKESCGMINVLSGFITFAGVVVIIRPPFLTGQSEIDTNMLIGGGFALGAMMTGTLVFLFLRLLKEVNYAVVTFFFGFIGCIQCTTLAVFTETLQLPETSFDWFLVVSLGSATFGGQVCTTLATKYEEAGIVALTRTMDVIFAFIWQLIFLGESPTIFSLVGSVIVISGICLIVLQMYLQNLPKDHPAREMLGCILAK